MNAVVEDDLGEELPAPEGEAAAPPKKAAGASPPPKKCPDCPIGAPAWMATFADMATLLLCFFVLILSFAEMNVPKFKQISGSMSNSFGVQKEIPVVEQPKGTTILTLNFSPSPTVALVDNLKQETTETSQPEIEVRSEDAPLTTEAPFESAGRKPVDSETPGAQGGGGPETVEQDAAKVRQALAAEVAAGVVEVKATATRVTVAFNAKENASSVEQMASAQAVASGVKKLSALTPELGSEVAVTGATKTLVDAIEGQSKAASASGSGTGAGADQVDAAAKTFEAAFAGEIRDGLVKVERKDGAVIVKVGSGGAFPTGDATLTPLASQIIEKIGAVAKSAGAQIVIGGHTDNVPINTVKYRDNWDLSAARAISVVRELVVNRGFDAKSIEAQGFADTRPSSSNGTAEGRGLNRRIEIEIRLPKAP